MSLFSGLICVFFAYLVYSCFSTESALLIHQIKKKKTLSLPLWWN